MAPKKSDVAVAERPFDAFMRFVQAKVAESDNRQFTDDLATQQVEEIAVAENLDDLFDAMRMQGMVGLRDLDNGTEIEIRSYRLVKSSRDDLAGRTGVFAIIDATDLFNDKPLALDTGIERVMAFLIKCEQLDKFPVKCRVLKKATQSGNEVITLGPVSSR